MWKVETKFRVRLGGNVYINTPDLIVYKGQSLFRIRRSDDGTLGIDFDVFNANGERVAIFAKNVVVKGDEAQYDIVSGHESYVVKEKQSDRVIASVQRRGVDGAELEVHAKMYLPNGFLLDASPEGTNLPGIRITGGVMTDCGSGIVIS